MGFSLLSIAKIKTKKSYF